IRALSPGDTPGPRSAMSATTRSPSRRVLTRTSPPEGWASQAFRIRLRNTCPRSTWLPCTGRGEGDRSRSKRIERNSGRELTKSTACLRTAFRSTIARGAVAGSACCRTCRTMSPARRSPSRAISSRRLEHLAPPRLPDREHAEQKRQAHDREVENERQAVPRRQRRDQRLRRAAAPGAEKPPGGRRRPALGAHAGL